MKKSTSRKNKGGLLQRYRSAKTKGNIANTGLKTLVDAVLGATLGAGIGASTGRAALPIGLVLMAGSHFMDEETGVMRVAGGAAIAYGIAKAIENDKIARDNSVNGFTLAGETSKAKTRLAQFKDELLTAFYLNKLLKKDTNKSGETLEEQAVGSIDLSALDVFDASNHNEAIRYSTDESDEDFYGQIEGGFESEGFSYSTYDEVDLSHI